MGLRPLVQEHASKEALEHRNKGFTTLSWKHKDSLVTQIGRLNADMLQGKPLCMGETMRSVIGPAAFAWR